MSTEPKKKLLRLVKKEEPVNDESGDVAAANKEVTVINSIGSFDIGMKNLAVCILDRIEESPGFRIREWKLISLVSQTGRSFLKCGHKIKPRGAPRARKCGKRASWWNSETRAGYCGTHRSQGTNLIRYTTTKNISDWELNQRLIEELNQLPELWRECHSVVVEAQKTSRMKKIIYMIMSYLSHQRMIHQESARLENVQVISASHKLAIPKNKLEITLPTETSDGQSKSTYDGRKLLANEHCNLLLQKDRQNLEYFKSQTKKDDLADSFLQGLCFLLKNY